LNGQVMPRPTALPLAVNRTTSDPLIWPVRFAVTVTTPPHKADTVPATEVSERLEICHWRLLQLPRFGSPLIADDAHVPAAAGTVAVDDEEDDVDEDDELADDALEVDGAVGSSRLLLLENWQPVNSIEPATANASAQIFFFIVAYTFVSAHTILAR